MRLTLLGLRVWSACLTIACAQGTATNMSESPAGADDGRPDGEARLIDAGTLDAGAEQDAWASSADEDARGPAPRTADAEVDGARVPEADGAAGPGDANEVDAQRPGPFEEAAAPFADAAPPLEDAQATAMPDTSVPPPPPATFAYAPSNVALAGLDFTRAPASTLGCGVTQIDTSGAVTLANWCGSAPTPLIRPQSGGPELVVLPLTGLTVAAGSTLRVVGSRPVVLMVQGTARIAGSIDVSARDAAPGPGGNSMCNESKGGNGRGTSGLDGSGGGGGGFGTQGGAGGTDIDQPGGPGIVRGNDTLVPLIGGCSGGPGGGCPGVPGGGGGGVQISVSAELTVSGSIQAKGGAGALGCGNDAGGTGGGSGGAILLEADALRVSGSMLSLGGGRGGNGQGGSVGGAGATRVGEPGGRGSDGSGSGGGGGGGGYGRLRLRGVTSCSGC